MPGFFRKPIHKKHKKTVLPTATNRHSVNRTVIHARPIRSYLAGGEGTGRFCNATFRQSLKPEAITRL